MKKRGALTRRALSQRFDQYVTGELMVLRVPFTVPLMGMPPGRMML